MDTSDDDYIGRRIEAVLHEPHESLEVEITGWPDFKSQARTTSNLSKPPGQPRDRSAAQPLGTIRAGVPSRDGAGRLLSLSSLRSSRTSWSRWKPEGTKRARDGRTLLRSRLPGSGMPRLGDEFGESSADSSMPRHQPSSVIGQAPLVIDLAQEARGENCAMGEGPAPAGDPRLIGSDSLQLLHPSTDLTPQR